MPAVVVSAISVSNSSFLGPVDLELNPQYNALIGGRGAGKSTILKTISGIIDPSKGQIRFEEARAA